MRNLQTGNFIFLIFFIVFTLHYLKADEKKTEYIRTLKNTLKQNTDDKTKANIYLQLARFENDFSSSLIYYKKIIANFKETKEYPISLIEAAELHEMNDNWKMATKYYQEYLNNNPDSSTADYVLKKIISALFQVSDYDKCQFYLQRLEQRSISEKTLIWAYYYKGKIYSKQNQLIKAEKLFLYITANHPDSLFYSDTLFSLAQNYEKQQKITNAAAVYSLLTESKSPEPIISEAVNKNKVLIEKYGPLDIMQISRNFQQKLKSIKGMLPTDSISLVNQTISNKSGEKRQNNIQIQCGYFSQKSNALNLYSLLKEKGYEPEMVTINNREGKLRYKVLLGNFKNSNEAKRVQQNLIDSGLSVLLLKES